MIFVTVGSTYFDELIRKVDELAAQGWFKEEVVCQIGSGSYIPRSCGHFRFSIQIEEYVENASLVITHGGMTVLEALWRNKAIVAIANTSLAGNHQFHFLKKLSQIVDVTWTDDLSNLQRIIPLASKTGGHFREPHIAKYIQSLIT